MKETDPPKLTIPWIESPFFERELEARRSALGSERAALAEAYHRDGYVVVEGLAPTELCDRVRSEVEGYFEESYSIENRRVPDAWNRGAESVRELALLPQVDGILEALYGRRPIPFQTLNFKWGTEQAAHSDAIHFTCLPSRFMCGVWVALEDIDEGNGPVFYYPGSQRAAELEAYDFGTTPADLRYDRYERVAEELMRDAGIEPVEFHARKGDVLIWASHILHGGAPVRRAGSTRWSQVTHFYFDDCIYYAPIYSDLLAGEYFLKDISNLRTGQPVPHSFDGARVEIEKLGNGRSRVHLVDRPGVPGYDGSHNAVVADGPSHNAGDAVALQAEIAALRASTSFRLGHALLAPVRLLRRR